MEVEIVMENPSQLCRICLNSGEYQLTEEIALDNVKVVLGQMLKEFSSVEINSSDNIPCSLCISCLSQLSDSYSFLKKVQHSDETIRRIFDCENLEEADGRQQSQDDSRNVIDHTNDSLLSTAQDETDDSDLILPLIETELNEWHEPIKSSVQEECIELKPVSKIRKRTAKKPNIVLTENVSHILSKVRKSSLDEMIEEVLDDYPLEGEPPQKKHRLSDNDSLIVTKFVLEPFRVVDSINTSAERSIQDIDTGEDQNNGMLTKSQIQTIDMAAVEVDANSKIRIEEIDDETNIEDPNRMYMCKYCPKAFSTSHHLLMHSRKSHICQFCTQSFTKVEDLHRHSKEAHTSFKCSFCDKDFSSNSNLRQHIKRVHNIELPAYVSLLSVKRKDTTIT